MEQKLRDFVRTEILNRFLAKRSDYPYGDPSKREELSQRVMSEMAVEMPTLEPLQEVCKLYELVDKVADMLAATFALGSSSMEDGDTSSQERLWEPLPTPVICSERWKQFYWELVKDEGGKEGIGMGVGVGSKGSGSHGVDAAAQDPFWNGSLLNDGGQNWIDDQESCGSIDTAKN